MTHLVEWLQPDTTETLDTGEHPSKVWLMVYYTVDITI